MKHTPAPWAKCDKEIYHLAVCIQHRNSNVPQADIPRRLEELEHTARLIQAAPAMYLFLEHLALYGYVDSDLQLQEVNKLLATIHKGE